MHYDRKTVTRKRCDLLKIKTSAEIDLSNESSFDYVEICFVQHLLIVIKADGLIKTPFNPLFSQAIRLKADNSFIFDQLPKNLKSSRKHLAALVTSYEYS